MLLWFVGTAVFAVRSVFQDSRFDYRLLIVGAVAPAIVDVPAGHARWAHSLVVAVGLLVVVMLTTGRKPIRRLALGLPIGMMLHLVFDGAFSDNETFLWPFLGDWGSFRPHELSRGWWSVVLEVVGAVMILVAWRTYGLADPKRRRLFLSTGQLVPTEPAAGR